MILNKECCTGVGPCLGSTQANEQGCYNSPNLEFLLNFSSYQSILNAPKPLQFDHETDPVGTQRLLFRFDSYGSSCRRRG